MQNNKIILGIDPGLNGGLALIADKVLLGVCVVGEPDANKQHLMLYLMPTISGKDYDIQEMKRILKYHRPTMAFIEQQIALPGQGLTSTLQTGKGFGILLGLMAALEIPHQVIGARQWQTKLFTGVSAKLDTKAKSEIIAKRLFPGVDFRRSERASKAHDGLTDAACIAEYGRRIDHNNYVETITGIPHITNLANPDICTRCGTFLPSSLENNCIK